MCMDGAHEVEESQKQEMCRQTKTLRIPIQGEPVRPVSLKLIEQKAAVALRKVRWHLSLTHFDKNRVTQKPKVYIGGGGCI